MTTPAAPSHPTGPAGPARPTDSASRRSQWRRIVGTYLFLLVVPGLLFGLFTAPTDRAGAWWIHGLIFGVLFSAILGTTVVIGQRGNTGSWSPRRTTTVHMPADIDTARRQAHIGLEQLQATIRVDDTQQLTARTGISWKTWGTRIDITFTPTTSANTAAGPATTGAETVVAVRVRPRVPTTLIDYGISNRIIDTLTYYLTPTDQPHR